jgi:ABC-type ATPase involved in cell division
MFNQANTFPYIGLRPFSEEDSLYFKGRDEQILQLSALLEANKFLMVTGASGDGKSSLVYVCYLMQGQVSSGQDIPTGLSQISVRKDLPCLTSAGLCQGVYRSVMRNQLKWN